MVNIPSQISSSMPKGSPSSSPVTCWIFIVCRAYRWESSLHTPTSSLILRQSSGGGEMGRHCFKLTAKIHWNRLLLFFSPGFATRGESEHLHVSCCLRKTDWVLFHFEKKQADPSRVRFHLHERRWPCHFHFLWGSLFSVLQLLRKFLRFL